MGIPSYFSFIVKNHPRIMRKLQSIGRDVDNLYLDSNSIIYDCLRNVMSEYPKHSNADFEKLLIRHICCKLDDYIRVVGPRGTVYVAFDGVAPVAKLEQQRVRRYKSVLLRQIKDQLSGEKQAVWDQTAITPGTNFMSLLGKRISSHYRGAEKKYGVERIIVSSSLEVGEGEHKIFGYIREHPKKHAREVTLVYGLDADLIMLSLNHLPISKHIYLYRETPEFIKSINANLEPNESYFLDIPALAQTIVADMNNYRPVSTKQQSNRLYDYILLCFFLGNDFMPHFPSVNIRTGGIHKMTAAYKNTIGKTNNNLTDGKKIFWSHVYTLISYLAEEEHSNLISEYKKRDSWESRSYPCATVEEKMERLNHIPTQERAIEKFINPSANFWQKRYYKSLFRTDMNRGYMKQICGNYLEGLEWTMKYYTSGCVDWRWKYNYNYPPLLQDLVKYVPRWSTVMIPRNANQSVLPHVQLAYVLPSSCLHLLPKKIENCLLLENGENYGADHEICWAFCKYFWESHVLFPHLDIEHLEDIVSRCS